MNKSEDEDPLYKFMDKYQNWIGIFGIIALLILSWICIHQK